MGALMRISLLRPYTDGAKTLEVDGKTVEECLQQLFERYPATRQVLLDAQGRLSPIADIRLNGRIVRYDGLSEPVGEDDVIWAMFVFGGG